MEDLLALCMLKGFFCHLSQSYAPKISFRYEQDKWIIQLLFLQTSLNPNELIVLSYLKKHIDHYFINKDIIILLENDKIIKVVEFSKVLEFSNYETLLNNNQINKLNDYLKNNCHYEIQSKEKINISEDGKFYVSQSTIPNAGLGLFSSIEFHRGEYLLTFKGKKIPFNEFCNKYPQSSSCIHNEYSLTAETYDRKKYVFDPINEYDHFILSNENFGPLINEPLTIANCESVGVSSSNVPLRVDLIATRFIGKNDEIFMLYNREPDKNYIPGSDVPKPIELKFKTNHKKTFKLLCFDMNWYNNNDWFRLVYWHNNSIYSVFTVGITPAPIEFQSFHFYPQDQNLITKNTIILYDFNSIVDVKKLNEYFTNGLEFAIIPFDRHPKKDLSKIYKYFLMENNYKFTIKEAREEKDNFLFDCYEFRNLDNTYPFLKITKNNFYTRFCDVWDEQRIINDMSLSDSKTIKWLQNYKRDLFSLKKLSVPQSKPMTLKYCSEL